MAKAASDLQEELVDDLAARANTITEPVAYCVLLVLLRIAYILVSILRRLEQGRD